MVGRLIGWFSRSDTAVFAVPLRREDRLLFGGLQGFTCPSYRWWFFVFFKPHRRLCLELGATTLCYDTSARPSYMYRGFFPCWLSSSECVIITEASVFTAGGAGVLISTGIFFAFVVVPPRERKMARHSLIGQFFLRGDFWLAKNP